MTTVTLTGSGTVFNPATDDGNSYIFTDGSELSFDSPGMNFVGGLSISNTNPLNSFAIEGAINQNFDDAPPGTPPVNVEVQDGLHISGDLGNDAELDDLMQPGTTLTVDGNSTFTYGGQFDVAALDNPGTPADTTVQLNGTISLSALGTNTLDSVRTMSSAVMSSSVVKTTELNLAAVRAAPNSHLPPVVFLRTALGTRGP